MSMNNPLTPTGIEPATLTTVLPRSPPQIKYIIFIIKEPVSKNKFVSTIIIIIIIIIIMTFMKVNVGPVAQSV